MARIGLHYRQPGPGHVYAEDVPGPGHAYAEDAPDPGSPTLRVPSSPGSSTPRAHRVRECQCQGPLALEHRPDLLDGVELAGLGREEEHVQSGPVQRLRGELAVVRGVVVQDEHRIDGGCPVAGIARQVLKEEGELLPVRGRGQHVVELVRGSRDGAKDSDVVVVARHVDPGPPEGAVQRLPDPCALLV